MISYNLKVTGYKDNYPVAGRGEFWNKENGLQVTLTQKIGVTGNPGYIFGFHSGIDLVGRKSKEITAFESGVVVDVQNPLINLTKGFGKNVTIKGFDGLFYRYAHLSRIDVKKGQTTYEGEVLGLEGSTGFSTGSHLHFDIRKTWSVNTSTPEAFANNWIDPLPLILNKMNATNLLAEALILDEPNVLAHALATGIITKEEVEAQANRPEKRGIMNEIYKALLKREIDDAGYAYWKDKTIVELIRGITSSEEYKNLNK